MSRGRFIKPNYYLEWSLQGPWEKRNIDWCFLDDYPHGILY